MSLICLTLIKTALGNLRQQFLTYKGVNDYLKKHHRGYAAKDGESLSQGNGAKRAGWILLACVRGERAAGQKQKTNAAVFPADFLGGAAAIARSYYVYVYVVTALSMRAQNREQRSAATCSCYRAAAILMAPLNYIKWGRSRSP